MQKPKADPDQQTLKRARRRLVEFQERADRFFSTHPYQLLACSASDDELMVCRFSFSGRIPLKLRWLARRLLADLRRISADLRPIADDHPVLAAIDRNRPSRLYPVLDIGVRARTRITFAERQTVGSSQEWAPHWHHSRRQVWVTLTDADRLSGAFDVKFHLKFRHMSEWEGRSATELLSAALAEAERLLRPDTRSRDALAGARPAAAPSRSGRKISSDSVTGSDAAG